MCDLIPVKQPWCKKLMIADIIDDKLEFRHWSVITVSTRKIQDYENKTLIKEINKEIRCLNLSVLNKLKSASLTIILMGGYHINLKWRAIYSTRL